MEKITIPEVGEIPMDTLSYFLGLLIRHVDLYRDLSERFDVARTHMSEDLDATNMTQEHSELIEGCRKVSGQVEADLQTKAFQDTIKLVDSIVRK